MKYISLLKGINVGGKRKVKMDDLKIIYNDLGFTEVKTYIQSGNVIFDSNETNIILLEEKIENKIYDKYLFQVPVIIKIKEQFEEILRKTPKEFIEKTEEYSKISITFLKEKVEKTRIELIKPYLKEEEVMFNSKSEIFMYCPNGFHKSKITSTLIEKKLKVESTARNLKTVLKLLEMLKMKESK